MAPTQRPTSMEDAAVKAVLDGLQDIPESQRAFAEDTACVRRYLRARQLNVKKASHALQETIKWREVFKPSEMKPDEFAADILTGRFYIGGFDSSYRPIIVTRKRSDGMQHGEEQHYLRFLVFTLETAIKSMRGGVEQWIWILDLNGYSRKNSPPISVSLQTLRILANHYPERLAQVYIVDAPAVFHVLYNIISPFVDPTTRAKVHFISSKDYENIGEKSGTVFDSTGFHKVLGVYRAPYDEPKYSRLLQKLYP